MRSDARENRERLLQAAGEHFAIGGPDVSLEAIARAAGVGIGTLYRHFPTREALIEAVYRNEVDQLCAAADELLAEQPPAQALAEWMERFVAYATTKRGLRGALKSIAGTQSDLFSDHARATARRDRRAARRGDRRRSDPPRRHRRGRPHLDERRLDDRRRGRAVGRPGPPHPAPADGRPALRR
jgi:AcrR family transcriptional regulator